MNNESVDKSISTLIEDLSVAIDQINEEDKLIQDLRKQLTKLECEVKDNESPLGKISNKLNDIHEKIKMLNDTIYVYINDNIQDSLISLNKEISKKLLEMNNNELRFTHQLVVQEDYNKAKEQSKLNDYDVARLACKLKETIYHRKQIALETFNAEKVRQAFENVHGGLSSGLIYVDEEGDKNGRRKF